MKSMVFLTPEDAAHGFLLAGIDHLTASRADFKGVLTKLMRAADHGMIVIDERFLTEDIERWLRETGKDWPGIVMILPPPAFAVGDGEDYAARLLRKAIGYHVRLNV